MAQPGDSAEPTDLLIETAHSNLRGVPTCTDFALAAIEYLREMAVGVAARQLTTCLNPNSYECHALVEVFDNANSAWLLVDPTFGLVPHRQIDGSVATSTDLSNAARRLDWAANYGTYALLCPSARI